jgi:hypothetical protein
MTKDAGSKKGKKGWKDKKEIFAFPALLALFISLRRTKMSRTHLADAVIAR